MAQYLYFANNQSRAVTDPVTGLKVYRGQWDQTAQKRAELVAGGISGLLNEGYVILDPIMGAPVVGPRFRWGLREIDGVKCVVWDVETTGTFDDEENVGWEYVNIIIPQ